MRKIILGRTNTTVSAISLGTWAFGGENKIGKKSVGWANQSDRDSRSVLIKAWEKNINHWDTADVYGEGHSERIIGSMWEDIPRKLYLLGHQSGLGHGPFFTLVPPKTHEKKDRRVSY